MRKSQADTKQYIIFAIFNAIFVVIIYFFLVETRKRSLEELDVVFAAGGNPVVQEQKMPHGLSVEDSRRILGLEGVSMEVIPSGPRKDSDDEIRFEHIRSKD